MTRYTKVRDRLPIRYVALDVRCRRCQQPPGQSCRRVRHVPQRVVVVDGRVRRLPAHRVITDEPYGGSHLRRKDDAALATFAHLRSRPWAGGGAGPRPPPRPARRLRRALVPRPAPAPAAPRPAVAAVVVGAVPRPRADATRLRARRAAPPVTYPVERGPLAWRRARIDGAATPVDRVEALLAAMRAELSGPVELYVERGAGSALVVTMHEARTIEVTLPAPVTAPVQPGKRVGQK